MSTYLQNASVRSILRLLVLFPLAYPGLAAPLQVTDQQRTDRQRTDQEQQRTDQFDKAQQVRDQQMQQDALINRTGNRNPLNEVQQDHNQFLREVAQRQRENFWRHHQALKVQADTLVKLAADLGEYVDNSNQAGLPRKVIGKAARMEKIAHQLRSTVADRGLPRMKSSRRVAGTATPILPTPTEARGLLLQKSHECLAVAAAIQQSIGEYLASDNEQAISLAALKRSSDPTHSDPLVIFILTSLERLERLSFELRRPTEVVQAGVAVPGLAKLGDR